MVQEKGLSKIIAIVGPTASGKTALSVELAKKIGGEIISCDSMQIYKSFDIGSAKTKPDEMQGIPHYMIDIVDGNSEFSVSDYVDMTREIISDIEKRNKVPIIVGGTGLYLTCLIKEQSLGNSSKNDEIRRFYEDFALKNGNEALYNELANVDEISAQKLHINDKKRIIRALEVYRATGKPFSSFVDEDNYFYNCFAFSVDFPREELYSRINERVDLMVKCGLFDEVKSLYSKFGKCQAMDGIGYKEVVEFLNGNITREESIELIKKNSRNYAKRQLTWFKHQIQTDFLDCSLPIFQKVDYIINKYNRG